MSPLCLDAYAPFGLIAAGNEYSFIILNGQSQDKADKSLGSGWLLPLPTVASIRASSSHPFHKHTLNTSLRWVSKNPIFCLLGLLEEA